MALLSCVRRSVAEAVGRQCALPVVTEQPVCVFLPTDDFHHCLIVISVSQTISMPSHSEIDKSSHVACSGTLSTNLTNRSKFTDPADSTAATSTVGTRACYRCGQEGHKALRCPNLGLCSICGHGGHLDQSCPWKKKKSTFTAAPKVQDYGLETATGTSELDRQKNSPLVTEAPDLIDLESDGALNKIPGSKRDAYGNFDDRGRLPEANTSWQDGREFGPVDTSVHLLDTPMAEQEEAVLNTRQVTLSRKHKGKKGKKAMYDLTPFLSY